MHIPPYYKKRSFQSFFLGVLTGVVIGYLFFLFVYGEHTERWIEENMEVRDELQKISQENDLLKQDKEHLSEENEERISVQSIEVELENAKQLDLDRFTEYELTDLVIQELNTIVGRNISSVSEQRDLLVRTIEHKTYTVRNINYSLEVTHLTISPILLITVEIHLETGGSTT